ncbi:hypothetical protein F2Q70_00032854 [Brassica cretica]|uniref:Tripeptidyl peptidase II second Ig-like domain-containing protein n=1 Tax=Brassica cretica TaxID=69181 RepID=A0A8S9FJJ3_BRACR|nr:hypothetical protein F2Q70_00032854 [Brassica cretica]
MGDSNYKFKLEDAAEVKPYIPLLNNRIYDTKFESQFYMISDANKRVYAMGDVYPESSKLPKGEYKVQLYLRHENVQLLEKLKQLTVFIERNMGEVRLNLHSEPDGPVTGNGALKSSVLMPGVKEAFYVGPPTKDKLPKNTPQGSVLVGEISYGKLSFDDKEGKNPKDNPAFYPISYVVPPNKPEEDKKAVSSTNSCKSVSERLEQEVRDTKIKFLGNLKQETEEERSEWKKLCACLKSEYPSYTPLLAKILEGLLSRSEGGDKISHHEEIIDAANEVVRSVDVDELARFLLDKSEPEDEEAEGEKEDEGSCQKDKFEENFKELTKWVDVKSSKFGTLTVLREKRLSRLGSALKVLEELIQNENQTANKKLYELKLGLLEELGWSHLATYEKQWMQRVYAMGDVYPESSKLPKGEYKLQLYLRHENVQLLEKLKQLTVFIERNMGEIRLNLHSEPDGPVTGNGVFKSSVLMPGVKEAFYLGPPTKDKLPKNTPQGSVLVGEISYGKLSFDDKEGKNPKDNPVFYPISFVVPPKKPDEDKKAVSSTNSCKSVSERLEQEVRDTKIKFLGNLKQETEEERSEWKKLCACLKSEYPSNTPLLAKILEGLLSLSEGGDKISHHEEIIDAANEVVRSVDVDELARFLLDKSEPEDEEAENLKKKMEMTRDQLAEALYQKGLAMARIENLKGEKEDEGDEGSCQKDKFEENFKELTKWVDVKSSKFGTLTVLREKRLSRLGTALKVLEELIQNENQTANKKLYELKLGLLEELGEEMKNMYTAMGEKEDEGSCQKDKFEENFKELTKWVDVKSSKFGTLTVLREKRLSRLGSALKVLEELIQNENQTANKKLYELKLGLLEELGWSHLATYEKQWMQVRFPTSLPLF